MSEKTPYEMPKWFQNLFVALAGLLAITLFGVVIWAIIRLVLRYT